MSSMLKKLKKKLAEAAEYHLKYDPHTDINRKKTESVPQPSHLSRECGFNYTYYTMALKCNMQQLFAIPASYENKHRPSETGWSLCACSNASSLSAAIFFSFFFIYTSDSYVSLADFQREIFWFLS